jgi:excisionase family DNA binding protein
MNPQDGTQLQLVADQATAAGSPAVRRGLDSGPPPLMTAQEVAELLRVPRSTVYELARNRRIPFLKVGRRTLFAQQTLLDWIAAQTVQPRR